MMVHKVTTRI